MTTTAWELMRRAEVAKEKTVASDLGGSPMKGKHYA